MITGGKTRRASKRFVMERFSMRRTVGWLRSFFLQRMTPITSEFQGTLVRKRRRRMAETA